MKKIAFIAILTFIFSAGFVFAQDVSTTSEDMSSVDEDMLVDPGLLPNHPLYFVKSIVERIGNGFAFGLQKKIERGTDIAERRLAEAKALAEQGNEELANRTFQRFQKKMEDVEEKLQRAKERQLENIEDISNTVAQATLKHQSVLTRVYEQVSEQAKDAISRALEASMRGHEMAVSAVSGEKREAIEQRISEKKNEIRNRVNNLRSQGMQIEDVQPIPSATGTPGNDDNAASNRPVNTPSSN